MLLLNSSLNNSLVGLCDSTNNKVWIPSLPWNVETKLTQFTADKNCIAYFYISIIPFQNGVSYTFSIYKNDTKLNSSVHGNASYTITKGAEYNDIFFVNVEEGDIIKFTTSSSSVENIKLRIDIKSNIAIS